VAFTESTSLDSRSLRLLPISDPARPGAELAGSAEETVFGGGLDPLGNPILGTPTNIGELRGTTWSGPYRPLRHEDVGPDGIRSASTRTKTESYHVKDQKITVRTAEIAIPLDGLNARPGSAVGFDVV